MSTVAYSISPILTPEERERLTSYLESTRGNLLGAVEGLTDNEWNFKPTPEQWSIAEVVEHLVLIESRLHARIADIEKGGPDDPRRPLSAIDAMIISEVPSGTQKVQAPEPLRPRHQWSIAELTEQFQSRREETLRLAKTAGGLRGRVFAHPIFGNWDGYQWMLGAAAHTERHTLQILELKRHPNFPRGAD